MDPGAGRINPLGPALLKIMRKSAHGTAIGIALLVAFGAGVAAAPSALAAPSAEEGFIRYEGTVTLRHPVFGARVGPTTGAAAVEIRCAAESECRLWGVVPEHFRQDAAEGIPILLTDGRAEVVQEAGDPCSSEKTTDMEGRLTVLANAREITVTWSVPMIECSAEEDSDVTLDTPEIEPIDPSPIPIPTPPAAVVPGVWMGGTAQATPASTADAVTLVDQIWSATYVDGDGCLVDASACPTPTPTPTPTTEPSPTAPTPEPTASEPVVPPPPVPAPEPTPSPVPPVEPPPVDAVATSWSEPSVLSDLSPVARLDLGPARIGVCAMLAIILVLLIAFPTARLNSAVERATDLFPRRPVRPPRHLEGWWQAAIGVVIASLITGFVDPEFGWNATSARVVATLLVALVIDVLLGWSARVWLMRRLYPRRPVTFRFVPVTLLIVVGAVALSRLLDFEPAIIFGLVAGIALSSALSVPEQARTELVAVGYGLVVSLAAWGLYTALPNEPGDPVSLFAHETLSAAAIAGAASLPLILFPARGLPGYAVFRWRPAVWAAVYALALFVFAVILMPMPESWAEVQLPLMTWGLIYALYFAVALVASKVVDHLEAARLSAA